MRAVTTQLFGVLCDVVVSAVFSGIWEICTGGTPLIMWGCTARIGMGNSVFGCVLLWGVGRLRFAPVSLIARRAGALMEF